MIKLSAGAGVNVISPLPYRHCAGASRRRYPHCEAVHAKSPAIYLIRPDKPVMFQQADDDEEIAAR